MSNETKPGYDYAQQALAEAGREVNVPAQGDSVAEAAAAAGDWRLAWAAQFIGAAQCLGHNRADRMNAAAGIFWKRFQDAAAAGE